MPKKIKRLPDSELAVMLILWEAGEPVNSAYVQEKLKDKKDWKITSVLTFLARLAEKGFVKITRQGKANIYQTLISEQEYLQNVSRSFLEKLYGNSLTNFVASLYESKAINDEDLAELEQFIQDATKEG